MYRTNDKTKTAKAAGNFPRALAFTALLAMLPTVGQSMTLAWTPNTNPVVVGFKIHYGAASRVYTSELSVGDTTIKATINGLVAGSTYYLAVTTYDVAGNESAFSDEIIYTVPAFASVNNTSPSQTVVTPVALATEPVPAQPDVAQPASATAAGAPVTHTVSAKKTVSSRPRQTAASPVASQSTKPANFLLSARNDLITRVAIAKTAKAKIISAPNPEKMDRSNPAPIARADSSVATAKNLLAMLHKPQPPRATDTLADTVVTRAALLYAAVSPFDERGNGQLDATEQIALVAAIMRDGLPLIGKNKKGPLTLAEASEVSLWIVAVHQHIARFDVNGDGKLLGTEQAELAAELEANEKLLPIFAPLMIE